MITVRKLALAAALAPALLAGTAYAAEPGFYLGAGAGQTTLKTDLGQNLDYDGPVVNPLAEDRDGVEIDADETGWKALLGYQFVPWLGLEAGYVELGSSDEDRDFTNGGDIEATVDVGGLEYYLVPSIPIGDHFEIFGKIGGFYGDISADGKFRQSAGAPRQKFDESSDEESMLAYGGGLAWNFGSGHWTLRAEYIAYDADNLDDLYQVGGSLLYRFFSDPAPEVAAAAPVAEAPPAACADADGDGVCDSDDQCPTTPAGKTVDELGCDCNFAMQLAFEFDSAELTAGDAEQLDKIAAVLTNPKVASIGGSIVGHTDSVGSEAYNMGLSQRRAESVAGHLRAQGVETGAWTVTGMGESQPIASNDTAEGRAQNRRVEVTRTECGQ